MAAQSLTDEDLAQIERDIFIGFYSVRKLCETVTKITDAMKLTQIQLNWHHNLRAVNWRNKHRIDNLYNPETRYQETRDIGFVCSQIIHSFIFVPCIDDRGGLHEIFFTSDTKKNKKLYSMKIEAVVAVFERVGNDDVAEIHLSRDPNGEEITTVR
jgi:hypothetical protein